MPHYIIYCDESSKEGAFYSDFYGGALINSEYRETLSAVLLGSKGNCQGEMKWTKISEYNEKDYILFSDAFLDLVRDNFVKMRIMFTQNINQVPKGTYQDPEQKYFKLYYQFVKHAFGLRYCNPGRKLRVDVSIYLDQVPDTPERFKKFKYHMASLSDFPVFKVEKISLQEDNITDVDSSKHIILQGVDVILGAMQFRLNEQHKYIPVGAKRRGKRTRAKERVYKHINNRLREMYPHFNVGITTGQIEGPQVRWTHGYRHWCFVPADSKKDLSKGKKKK